jgi:hypothetical protein
MDAISKLKRVPRMCVLALGVGTLAATVASPTLACSWYYPAMPRAQPVAMMQQGGQLMEAVYRARSAAFIAVAHDASDADIVGLWNVAMVSDGVAPNPVPAGATVDFGTVQWHDDGTEFMISGGRPPSTGDTCMGVWQQTGPRTYKLKHLALAWVSSDTPPSMGGPGPSPSQFLGPAVIREVVTLGKSGASYQGSFTIDQYNANQTVLLVHVSGTVTGTRVTVD